MNQLMSQHPTNYGKRLQFHVLKRQLLPGTKLSSKCYNPAHGKTKTNCTSQNSDANEVPGSLFLVLWSPKQVLWP